MTKLLKRFVVSLSIICILILAGHLWAQNRTPCCGSESCRVVEQVISEIMLCQEVYFISHGTYSMAYTKLDDCKAENLANSARKNSFLNGSGPVDFELKDANRHHYVLEASHPGCVRESDGGKKVYLWDSGNGGMQP